jgi:D-glycero-alpha-D-manno-heptose-7-phosphate kinase
LLNALHAFQGRYASPARLAEQACQVEIDLCSEPIGKQDQYAAAFGGLNLIEFHANGRIDVTPVLLPAEARRKLERSIVTFYTGVTRRASPLLQTQIANISGDGVKQAALRRMVQLSYMLKQELESGNLDSFGEILHENWELKKSLSDGISSPEIDEWYETARHHGALGGKILGAGAGGFLIFTADPDRHQEIALALSGLRPVRFGFEPLGSRIIFYNL